MATASARPANARQAEHRYYVLASILTAVIVLVGFSRTYYLKEFFHTPPLLPILQLHAAVFTSWIVLFITQSWLVSAHRTRLHMRLGIAGFLLAVAMLVVGTATAITMARLGHTRPGGPPPLVFMVIPIFDMLIFSVLIAAGFFLRKRPDYHKRIMLVATASLMTAAFGRIILITHGTGNVQLALTFMSLLVLAITAVDAFRTRRIHPAFAWTVPLVILSAPIRLLVARTDTWMSFARWLTK